MRRWRQILKWLWGKSMRMPEPAGEGDSRERLGRWGEGVAAAYLGGRGGMEVLERNWRAPADRRLELDLVCREGRSLVFVEVRTRRKGARVTGYHSLNRRKKRALLEAVRHYLRSLGEPARPWRFDVVDVAAGGEGTGEGQVRHFRGVPLER